MLRSQGYKQQPILKQTNSGKDLYTSQPELANPGSYFRVCKPPLKYQAFLLFLLTVPLLLHNCQVKLPYARVWPTVRPSDLFLSESD